MDMLQMLKNAQAGKPIESLKCKKCNDTGREKNKDGKKCGQPEDDCRLSICSCPAGNREAKRRAEKQK